MNCLRGFRFNGASHRLVASDPPFLPYPYTQSHPNTKENNSIAGIGVDGLMAAGALDQVKNGPLFWVRILYYIYT